MAAWYKVPKNSLAKRRAPDELTAAHNKLPIGTRVLVTNPENGKSVTVRITDRGIHDRRVKLDLCKEAAEAARSSRQRFRAPHHASARRERLPRPVAKRIR